MIAEPGEITEQVCQRLRDDDLVIADVTGGNPNVMYELGLRHTKNKLTIQLGERERLPFDINVIRTIQLNRNETGLVEARDSLEKAIRTGVERGPQLVTATRVWLGSGGTPELVEAVELQEPQEEEEPGFLDMLAETEEAVPLFAQVADELTRAFEGLNPLTNEMTREIAQSDARGGGAAGRLRVAQNFAERLEEPANDIEQTAANFVGELTRMAPGISYQIGLIEENPSLLDNNEEARQFADSIRTLAQVAGESLAQVGTLADSVQNLGKISNRLRSVSRRMSLAIRRISDTSRIIEEWGDRMDRLES